MKVRKPTFWAGVALLILLLGIAVSFGLTGWNVSGIGTGEVSIPGAAAMFGGVIAGVILCIGLLAVIFTQPRASGRPVVSPPSMATPRRQSERY